MGFNFLEVDARFPPLARVRTRNLATRDPILSHISYASLSPPSLFLPAMLGINFNYHAPLTPTPTQNEPSIIRFPFIIVRDSNADFSDFGKWTMNNEDMSVTSETFDLLPHFGRNLRFQLREINQVLQ